MPIHQENISQKSVSPLIAIVAVVIVLAIVGGLIYRGISPHSGPPTAVSAQQSASDQWLIGKAQEAKGDFNSLSPADQQKVQEITKGAGTLAINALYQKK